MAIDPKPGVYLPVLVERVIQARNLRLEFRKIFPEQAPELAALAAQPIESVLISFVSWTAKCKRILH